MSKSKGNYIGITEAPKVMFRKIMRVNDTLMWRYWELLTDASLTDIAEMKLREPMAVKRDLAERIVTDFNGPQAGKQAREDWVNEVQEGGVPADIEEVTEEAEDAIVAGVLMGNSVHVPRLLSHLHLAQSRTEAERLIKSGAIEINGERWRELTFPMNSSKLKLTVRAGKRWKIIVIS
jgi:tyrosyl-tRNA synthetase